MPTKVLDSWALMAFFNDEPAAEEVEKLLIKAADDKYKLLLSVINWGEIYYSVMRGHSAKAADEVATQIAGLAIELVPVAEDLELVRQAAIFKATKRMSYADCFAAALAKTRKIELVTGDLEFKELQDEIKIVWLRT